MTTPAPGLTAAYIVPDEQTWALSGRDPAAYGLRPVFALGQARRLLVPDTLPTPLEEPLRSLRDALPAGVEVEARPLPGMAGAAPDQQQMDDAAHGGLTGHEPHQGASGHATDESQTGHERHRAHEGGGTHEAHADHQGHGAHGDHEDHEPHEGHAGHAGHGDMMAIVGEPSADGLVMEPIELRFGPLGTPLPGGLAIDIVLDGDVVAESAVHALLAAGGLRAGAHATPDLLAPVAWTLAIEAAAGAEPAAPEWCRLAALESERALSHLAWLRALGRLLGWSLLVERCTATLQPLAPCGHELARHTAEPDAAVPVLRRAAAATGDLARLVTRSRLLRARTAGLGVLAPEHLEHSGVRGPVARASGLSADERVGNALYAHLDFTPAVRTEGDAYARALVRIEEAREALRLAEAALEAQADGAAAPARLAASDACLEGPRGPLQAERTAGEWRLGAPGADAALRAAGEAVVGAEWSAALVALASFDLSPWSATR